MRFLLWASEKEPVCVVLCAHVDSFSFPVRRILPPQSYIILVEHDLSVLDYMSDFVCCLYGKPGAYGVVTMPFSVREGTWKEGRQRAMKEGLEGRGC